MSERPVRDALRRLFGDTLVYGLGRIAGNVVGLVLLPVYTYHLAVAKYGLLDNLFVLSMLLASVISLGVPDAFQRFWFLAKTEEERREVVGSTLAIVFTTLLFAIPPLLVFGRPILSGLFGDTSELTAFRLVALTLLPGALMNFGLAILRATFRSTAYSLCSVAQVATLGVVNTWLVAGLGMGVTGVFLGGAISAASAAGLALYHTRHRLSLARSRTLVRSMLSYGIPLVPSYLAFWTLMWVDRWLLVRLSGLHEAGLYAAGAKVAGVMLVLNFAVLTAFNPVALRLAGRPEAKRFQARAMTAYAAIAASMAVALSALAPQAMSLLTPDTYHAGRRAVAYLTLGFFFSGLTIFLSIGLQIVRRTTWITWTALIAAASNVGLNLLLIPRFGLVGAAIATAAAYAVMAAMYEQVTRRFYRVDYERGPLIRLAFLLSFGLGLVIGLDASGSTDWPFRLAIAAVFPLGVLAARVVRLRDLRQLLATAPSPPPPSVSPPRDREE